MSLNLKPGKYKNMDPSEVEFLTEKQNVAIVPNFTQNKIYLIGGDLGPFSPGLQVDVPLWVGINLKQRRRCKILPPEWMDVENLETKRNEETESKFFTEMPNRHYMEITQLLLQYAADDIPQADKIRTLIKDIWDIRVAKLRSSVHTFVTSDSTHAKLNHLTMLELNTVRPFLTEALDHMQTLRSNMSSAPESSQSQD